MKKVLLKIITPKGLFWNSEVEIVTLKTTEGYIGLMYGKSPFIASLDIAELQINKSNSKDLQECAIAGGLVYATKEKIEILTDAIEKKENIDLNRAKKKKEHIEYLLKQKTHSKDKNMLEISFKKAVNRLRLRKK